MKTSGAIKPTPHGAESFRIPTPVTEVRLFRDHTVHPVCPRCHITMEREYQAFCGRCGQALNWSSCQSAIAIAAP